MTPRRRFASMLRLAVLSIFAMSQTAQAVIPPAEGAARVKALGTLFAKIEANIPRERFDISAAVKAAGLTTAERVRDWIATETVLVPYAGTLRGAAGVLEDRRGNALDRALLAAAMLHELGIDARLARATLSDADAALLVATIGSPKGEAAGGVPVPADPAPFVEAGLPQADVEAALVAQVESAAAIRSERARRLDIQPGWLAGLAGSAPAELADTERDEALASLRDHWWIQAEVGGAWIDLDPSGSAFTVPVAASAILAIDDVPVELRHTVTLRVIAEVVEGGVAHEALLLTETLDATAAATQPLTLGFEGGGAALALGGDGAALLAAGAAAKGWLPRLSMGRDSFAGEGILMTGEVRPASDPVFASDQNVGGAVAGGVGGATDLIGGMGEEPAAAGLVTAMWLEVDVSTPDKPVVTERRVLFDLVGAGARAANAFPAALTPVQAQDRAAALMGLVDVVVQTAATSPDRAAFLATSGLRGAMSLIVRALEASANKQSLPPNDLSVPRMPIPLYVYGAARFFGADGIYIDRPNVVALHVRQVLVDGELTQQSALDVIANGVGVVGPDAFTARIAQGVRDTVAEDQSLAFPAESANASARHAAYTGAGVAFAPLAPGALPPDEAALAAAQVKAGYAVFAPTRTLEAPGSAVWWRVDPKTGTTLGFGPMGYGSTTAETVSILVNIGLRLVGVFICSYRLGAAQQSGNTCGMVAAGLCLAGAIVSTVGVAGKALGEMGALTAQWVGNAGIAAGLVGAGVGGYCR